VLVSAGLLLAILAAHLVVMASPLHGAVQHPGQAMEHAPGSVAHHSPMPAHSGQVVAGTAGDCALLWIVPSQRSQITAVALAVPAAPGCVFAGLASGLSPLPRTPGPPLRGDPQALLQVFRI